MTIPSIASLLQQVATPDGPAAVLALLREYPYLANQGDENGYTLLHAAASYDAFDLATALVLDFKVDANVRDSDGDTPLYFAETGAMARMLLEALGASADVRNNAGESPLQNAEENAEDTDGEWGEVAGYLRGIVGSPDPQAAAAQTDDVHPPPPLPPNVRVNVGTMSEQEVGNEADVDPEFRQRIEELAGRDDFSEQSGQEELRKLVEDAVSGVSSAEAVAASRRRVN